MSKAFTLDTNGLDLLQEEFGNDQVTYTAKAYLDGSEDTLDVAGSPHGFRTAAGTDLSLPDNAVITNIRLDCITLFASGGAATIALGIETGTDVKVATAFDAVPFDGSMSLETVLIKTTAAQTLDATVAGADLTSGRIIALIDYYVTE